MSRSAVPRPTLIPGLPRLWRDPHTLQLGLDPPRAVLVDLPDPRAARILDLLDGSRPERVVLRRATADGIAPADARALLDALHAARLVLPAPALWPAFLTEDARHRLTGEAAALALQRATVPRPPGCPEDRAPSGRAKDAGAARAGGPGGRSPAATLRRRLAARVVVTGHGRLGAAIAVALAEAGVGHVHPDLPGPVALAELPGGPLRGTDVGTPRSEAVASALRRRVPGVETRPVRRGAAALLIQLGYAQPTALVAAAHLSRRQPHLAVSVRDGVAVVGPCVPPAGAPCLRCVELHRRERDAGRPEPADRPATGTAEPCPVATLLTATGYATAEALTYLDGGRPETVGAAVEIAAPGRFRRRSWTPHPDCGCRR
ncbi:ThiF family adenylyltransferase [Jidongwangia harbinensis]|uniref:ThiF family adenylyltransferase n=1 Tax=Jidongwangia harbinensis TaxID=2878561 RepID=UPI001CD9B714|nr:ThiF family adenylyltransferase [Jidongwangia harbinensis]MCA2213368.1 ThiF family adenylyltransferase [Jidongwangia harbinensis]